MAPGLGTGRFDIAIVGAGPAGCSAAIVLARAGRRVVLIERHCFPREKVCGGCVSGAGVQLLRELLGPRALPGVATVEVAFVIGAHRLSCRPRGATLMVPRSQLDACLLAAAVDSGAVVCCGEAANLAMEAGAWRVVVAGRSVAAGTVLLACGLSGLLARLPIAGRSVRRRMIGQQWVQPVAAPLPPHGCVELHWLRGGYVGLATPDPQHCVIALAAEVGALGRRSPFEHLRLANSRARIWEMLAPDAPRRFAARGSAGFPWQPRRVVDRNLLLVGDAAGYEEPYTGEGIGQALASGRHAARAVLQGGAAAKRYAAAMRRQRRLSYRTRLLSRLLGSAVVHAFAARRSLLPERLLARLVERVHVQGAL